MTPVEKIAELFHTAGELQAVSNNAHLLWGISLLIVTGLLFLYSFDYKKKLLATTISCILLGTILLFTLYLALSRGITHFWDMIQILASFPELYVHTIMSLVAFAGICIELLATHRYIKHPLAPLALPVLSSIGVGFLFILHPHSGVHDTSTMFVHSLIGSALIISGILIILQRLIRNAGYERLFGIIAAILLVFSGILLIQFKEPVLAYQSYFPVKENMSPSHDHNENALIYIAEDRITPQNIRIKKGGSVTFYQIDNGWHDISSGPHPVHTEYPPLNIGFLKKGETHTVTFEEVGTYGFHDHISESNPLLQGKIEVY